MTTLAQYSAARAALADASRVDQVLHVRDEVEHLHLYARQIKDRTLMADALELQLRCERRLGQLLVAAKEAGQVSRGAPKKNCADQEQFPRVRLEDAGIDRKLSSKAQKVANLSECAFAAMIEQARNRLAGTAAKPVNKTKPAGNREQDPDQQPVTPAAQVEPPKLDHYELTDASISWRRRFDQFWKKAPDQRDREWALRVIAHSSPIPPHNPVTGEIIEGEAEQSSSESSPLLFIAASPAVPQACDGRLTKQVETDKREGAGRALVGNDTMPRNLSGPIAPIPADDFPELPAFLDRRLKAS